MYVLASTRSSIVVRPVIRRPKVHCSRQRDRIKINECEMYYGSDFLAFSPAELGFPADSVIVQ